MPQQAPRVKKLIGIDPGTRIAGYAVIELDKGAYVLHDFGCIRIPQSIKGLQKYLILHDSVASLIQKHSVDSMAIETPFLGTNAQSALKLGRALGSISLAALEKDLPIFEFAPTQVKKGVTGNGRASKEQVQKMVQLLLKLPKMPEPKDISDALAIAICGLNVCKKELSYV